MGLFSVTNWLKTPNDRDIIARWTVGQESAATTGAAPATATPPQHSLDLPQPPDPDVWEFLALGDSGDSDAAGPGVSPQDAVAQQMGRDADLPEQPERGRARMVLHMGDVIYMTGERRLYDRNFRRPYAPFLAPQSTVDSFVFRMPFLPVPGNHDYYDLGGWAMWLSRVPILGAGLRAIAHRLFAFSLPEGGSDMGRAYMNAFVDLDADTKNGPLPYAPGERTRLPNRYYKFRMGNVDFFALDSNTLDAPPPGTDVKVVREDAARRVAELEERAKTLDAELRRNQLAHERERAGQRDVSASDPDRRAALAERVTTVAAALSRLVTVLKSVEPASDAARAAVDATALAERRWSEGAADLLESGDDPAAAAHALDVLDDASDEGCAALRAVEGCLSILPEGAMRAQILGARDEVNRSLDAWADLAMPAPSEVTGRLHRLSEEALDVQRELVLERRRMRYRREDCDLSQLTWLERALEESVRERPDAWRIVYMHHPIYTTISNHCERPDVTDVRENLMPLLKDRVHLLICGHSHTLEWFRSDALPHMGLFVTGGGGQISLRPSLLDPRRVRRHPDRYEALRHSGVVECAMGGHGPAASDGEAGPIYHYLRVEVTPDALIVHPVGVRRLENGSFRREEPMPVFHAADLPPEKPPWKPRRMEAVEIRRDAPPRARWQEK